ncbi:unnamed protein product [Nyctereutes procyonoides]|uniref:(raccoon dog) hypothetical protein n=1 Tax=Nyctereutes procyonoides TaxID=34880 RepID=A0A811YC25_NYCPR|nr:unnamed protein product [Nyctereutes procyonoides]
MPIVPRLRNPGIKRYLLIRCLMVPPKIWVSIAYSGKDNLMGSS